MILEVGDTMSALKNGIFFKKRTLGPPYLAKHGLEPRPLRAWRKAGTLGSLSRTSTGRHSGM
jgi:hypothetical protein